MYPAEATPGIEPGYRVLQTLASPLGHVAETSVKQRAAETALRADDRIRTGDLNLGKVALYQLSYVRAGRDATTEPSEQIMSRSIRTPPNHVS